MQKYWPESIDGIVPTKNNTGFMFEEVSGTSSDFLKDIQSLQGTVIDLGCAYGITTIPCLKNNDLNVVAFDLSSEHLEVLRQGASSLRNYANLKTICGQFPNDFNFPVNSISAIHSSYLFHFLNGAETELALQKLFKSLRPGGKLYINTCSVHFSLLKEFKKIYEHNLHVGKKWPGEISNFQKYIPESSEFKSQSEEFLHVHSLEDFENALKHFGFHIEKSFYYDLKKPKSCASGGKWLFGVIASKG